MVGIAVHTFVVPEPDEIWWRSTLNAAVEASNLSFLDDQVAGNLLEVWLVVSFIHLAVRSTALGDLILLCFSG